MANLPPLQKFLSITRVFSGTQDIYETPEGVTGIVLSMQIANPSGTTEVDSVTVLLQKPAAAQVGLLFNSVIPRGDALTPLTGKVVLEVGDKLVVVASEQVHVVLSLLENANE